MRRGKNTVRVALLAVAALSGLGVVGLFAWGLFVGFERPLEAGDREVLVTFEPVAGAAGGLVKAEKAETTTRRRFVDGSYEVSYDYEAEELTISSSVNHERSPGEARKLYEMTRLSVPLGAKAAGDVEIVPRSDLFSGGDARYSAAITSGGVAGGHLLVVLRGKNVMTVTIGGVFIDSPADFQALVQPRVDALARLR